MKLKLLISACIIFYVPSVFAQDDIEITTLKKVGDNLPVFTAQALSGKMFSSNELKGKVVLINFWATWCPPCRTELPLLQKNIYDKIKNKDFAVLAFSRGEVEDTVKKFISKNKYTFPVYLDTNKKVYELFAGKYIPRNFVIGKNGKIKWQSTGFTKEEFNKMIKLIEKELKN